MKQLEDKLDTGAIPVTSTKNNWMEKADKAFEALIGKRDDVYPCREDVPAELWGEPIISDGGELGSTGVNKGVETKG